VGGKTIFAAVIPSLAGAAQLTAAPDWVFIVQAGTTPEHKRSFAMRISLFAPLANPEHDPAFIAALARGAEERGFHGVWLGEHVVLFDEYQSRYPYAGDGRIPIGGERCLLEPFTALSFMAAHTTRLRLGTGICLVPQRNPVYTAKEVAAVDYLSGGRLDFGVGVGWLAEEFKALGVPWQRRGARCRAYLDVMSRLWNDEIAEYEGEFYTLPPCRQNPKPVQPGGPPVYFGGESEAAFNRVADLGQGWYGFNVTPEDLGPHLERLVRKLAERGRTRADVDIAIAPYSHPLDKDIAARYRDAGVDQLVVMILARDIDGLNRRLDGFAQDYL
jgi:probable F420-dependent oxidoreductase